MLECDGLKMDTNKEFGASNESNEEGSNGENGSPQKGRGAAGKRKKAPPKKSPLNGVSQEGKQVQRNAANARERARMRVLSKAFSRLKTTLPWVPPDTKLSKLDTLRLASSYIAHLRQILANDKYENGYIHPVNLVSHGPLRPGTCVCVCVCVDGEKRVRSWDAACAGRKLHVLLPHRGSSASPWGDKGFRSEGTSSQLPPLPASRELSVLGPIRCSLQSPPGVASDIGGSFAVPGMPERARQVDRSSLPSGGRV